MTFLATRAGPSVPSRIIASRAAPLLYQDGNDLVNDPWLRRLADLTQERLVHSATPDVVGSCSSSTVSPLGTNAPVTFDVHDEFYSITYETPEMSTEGVMITDGIVTATGQSAQEAHAAATRSLNCTHRLPADAENRISSTKLFEGQDVINTLAANSPRFRRWLKANGYLKA